MSFLNEQLTANGGTGSPETLGRIVTAKAIFDFITRDSIQSISVNNAGSGYVAGETFDIVVAGSPGEFFTARGVVVSVSTNDSPMPSPAGQVTEVKIISGGAYDNLVQSPELALTGLSTTNASASGSGLTVDAVAEEAHWTQDRGFGVGSPLPSTDYVDDRTDFEWICTSTKSTNPPTVGLQTGVDTGNGFLELMVATGFDSGSTFGGQPGASPVATDETPRLLTPGNDPQIYISSTERRVNIMIRDGNFVQYGTIGFFIPYTDTEANYPFPGAVFGQTAGALNFSSSRVDNPSAGNPVVGNAGVIYPMNVGSSVAASCPYKYRDNLSAQWLTISRNTSQNVALRSQMWPHEQDANQYDFSFAPQVNGFSTDPFVGGNMPSVLSEEWTAGEGWFQSDAGSGNGIQGIGPLGLGNRLSFVVQPHIIANQTGDVQIIGITDGYEAVHGRGLTSFEEIVQNNGKRYVVFPDTNSGFLYHWVAMEIV